MVQRHAYFGLAGLHAEKLQRLAEGGLLSSAWLPAAWLCLAGGDQLCDLGLGRIVERCGFQGFFGLRRKRWAAGWPMPGRQAPPELFPLRSNDLIMSRLL